MWDQARKFFMELVSRNRDRHAIPVLDGPLKPNKALDEFKVECDFLRNPDDIAIDSEGAMYVSTENRVLKLSGENHQKQEIYVEFEDGLPGGLNFHPNGQLMVCVGGKGLVLINDEGRQNWVETAAGKPIRCPTAAIAGPDGRIFVSDGTVYHDPNNWVFDLMEKRSAGRLICYDKDTEATDVLLSGLSYPHGLAISHDSMSLIICESWKHSVSAYPVDDIRPATEELLVPNLPGYPARMLPSAKGGYWMSLFSMRTNLIEFVLTESKYRKEMMQTIEPDHWVAPALSSGKDFFEPLQGGGIKQLGITKPWAPPRSYGLVIKFDQDFDAVGSYHSRVDGMRHGITGIAECNGELFIVSKGGSLILKATEEVGI